jgi:CubicO group peptidase (beta-lactamase class C family)
MVAPVKVAAQSSPAAAIASDPKVAAKLRAAEAWLETRLARDNVTGASVAIVHDQQLVWARGFGYANLAKKVPVTPQTRFSVCSISKLFTSVAAMRERDSGRLDLDKPIQTYGCTAIIWSESPPPAAE